MVIFSSYVSLPEGSSYIQFDCNSDTPPAEWWLALSVASSQYCNTCRRVKGGLAILPRTLTRDMAWRKLMQLSNSYYLTFLTYSIFSYTLFAFCVLVIEKSPYVAAARRVDLSLCHKASVGHCAGGLFEEQIAWRSTNPTFAHLGCLNMHRPQIQRITLWLFNIAMENGRSIDGLPIKNGGSFHGYVK